MISNKLIKNLVCILVVLLPFLFTFSLSIQTSVNTPYMDDWELVKLFKKSEQGKLGFSDLWEQHNEHRMFFVKASTVYLGSINNWNIAAQTILSTFLALGILTTLVLYIKRYVKNTLSYVLYMTVISSLLFSFVQWENWTRGFQMQWFFCTFAGIAALYLLDKNTKIFNTTGRFISAASLCFIATFSLGSGLFFWIAGFVPLILNNQGKKKISIWAVLFLISTILYFINYLPVTRHGYDIGLLSYVKFFFAYLGSPFTFDLHTAVVFGIILTGLLFVLLHKALIVDKIKPSNLSLPIGIIIFVAMSDLVTMVSRAPVYGVGTAVASRYTTIAVLFTIALVLICMQIPKINKTYFSAVIIAVICLTLTLGVTTGSIYKAKELQTKLINARTCLQADTSNHICLQVLYPDPQVARDRLVYLKEKHLAGF